MDITAPRGITVTALTLLLVAGMAPLGTVGATPGHECDDNQEFHHYITLSNPLVGQTSASELVQFMVHGDQEALEKTNGIDAYVIDLGEDVNASCYDLIRTLNQEGDYEFNVRFFSSSIQQVAEDNGELNEPMLDMDLPSDARYVVIELEQGPLVNGFEAEHGPGFYSVAFEFTTGV